MNETIIAIAPGYRPGVIGRCLELQASYYARHAAFGPVFEVGRANDIAAFFAKGPAARREFWSAVRENVIVGTVAIDGDDVGPNIAQLRWFIVDDSMRGTGLGRRLLDVALDFCDRIGFVETHLWTFAGLDAARHLYETNGFVLIDESSTSEWGPSVLKQHFVRTAAGAIDR